MSRVRTAMSYHHDRTLSVFDTDPDTGAMVGEPDIYPLPLPAGVDKYDLDEVLRGVGYRRLTAWRTWRDGYVAEVQR